LLPGRRIAEVSHRWHPRKAMKSLTILTISYNGSAEIGVQFAFRRFFRRTCNRTRALRQVRVGAILQLQKSSTILSAKPVAKFLIFFISYARLVYENFRFRRPFFAAKVSDWLRCRPYAIPKMRSRCEAFRIDSVLFPLPKKRRPHRAAVELRSGGRSGGVSSSPRFGRPALRNCM
jgi:hypothetical protein